MARYEHSGSAQDAHLLGTLSATGLGLTIDGAAGWPTGATNKFWIAVDPDTSMEEHILINTRTGTGLTVASIADRGLEGTSAVQHSPGAVVRHIFSATEADDMALLSGANVFTAANRFTAEDHYFGSYANSTGSGSRMHIGSFSDTVAAYLAAEGYSTDISFVMRQKGAGSFFFQTAAGATKAQVTPAGAVYAIGADHYFGSSALGAAGTHAHVFSTSTTAVSVYADGSAANVDLVTRAKGTGAVYIQDGSGTTLLQSITPANDNDVGVLLAIKQGGVVSVKNVYQGAADSAGAGYRHLMVGN